VAARRVENTLPVGGNGAVMQIRRDQIRTLQRSVDQAFVQRVCHHLRDHHPKAIEGLDIASLDKRVTYGIERARSYGLTAQNALAAFVTLMFEIGPAFDEQTDIQCVLRDPLIGPNDRMEALPFLVRIGAWEEAGQTAIPDAWERILSGR
jgi:hypothetical protein